MIWPAWRVSKLEVSSVSLSSKRRRRAHAGEVSLTNSLRWADCIIGSVDKTEL